MFVENWVIKIEWFIYIAGYNMKPSDREDINATVLTYHRIVEAFKFGYAWRSLLGDPDFVQNVHLVSHIAIRR